MDETDRIQEKEFGSTKQKWKIRAKSVAQAIGGFEPNTFMHEEDRISRKQYYLIDKEKKE